MKKPYITPESRIIAINLSEGIAVVSGGISEISGSAVIKFTHDMDGCRGRYTGVEGAKVDPNITTFMGYYEQLLTYGADVYFNCFRYQFS